MMKRYHYREISSTNDYAKEHLKNDNFVVVSADFQTRGRGRNENEWQGEFGKSIYLSFGRNHAKPLIFKEAMLYQAIGALAVKRCLSTFAPQESFKLKYPNDVYAQSGEKYKKISGILVEHGFVGEKCHSSILGIGININQNDFDSSLADNAVSMNMLGYNLDIDEIYTVLIDKILEIEQKKSSGIFTRWVEELGIIGREIEIKGKQGDWRVENILEDGRLEAGEKKSGKIYYIDNGDSVFYKF